MKQAQKKYHTTPNTIHIIHEDKQEIRLNKFIAQSGFCSRRQADLYIQDNEVLVNGIMALPGQKVSNEDVVVVDDNIINKKEKQVYILLNKEVGVTSSMDPEISDSLYHYLPHDLRIFMVGRLDKDSQGLILMSNDGDIVNKILRVENNHEKEYRVTLNRAYDEDFINAMEEGIEILGEKTLPTKITRIDFNTFNITLRQGLNRQIRRMCSALGYRVEKLVRFRIMHLNDQQLACGYWRYLSDEEIKDLANLIGAKVSN